LSNGLSSGGLEFYINTDDLIRIGEALADFPEHNKAKFLFERGSEPPEDNHANYFRLRACCIRGGKSYAIQLRMNNNTNIRGAYFELPEMCEFYIETSLERIKLLGQLFLKFSKLEKQRLYWSDKEAFLDIDKQFQKGEARDNIYNARQLLLALQGQAL